MQGNLRPDDPIADALVHSVAPGGNILAIVGIEVNGIHVFVAGTVAPAHQDGEGRSAAIREGDAAERGAGIERGSAAHQRPQVEAWAYSLSGITLMAGGRAVITGESEFTN